MSLLARDTFFMLLSALWLLLLLLWRHSSNTPRPVPMSSYIFSAKTPLRPGKTTVLQFAAPSRDSHSIVPTILRTLDALNVIETRAR